MNKAVLVILDGLGINEQTPEENAITQAHAPTFTKLFASDHARLGAHGLFVGVPKDMMGNSEIGHMTLGSGRISNQKIIQIDELLDSGMFETKKEFEQGIQHCRTHKSQLHLLQIFGPGCVHGSDAHLKKLLHLIPEDIHVCLHLFGDGRDIAPHSMLDLMKEFENFLKDFPHVEIATLSGRYYAMDRDNNWVRTQKAYDEIMFGSKQTSDSPSDHIAKTYENGKSDEFLEPVSFVGSQKIENGDTVFFLNHRSDRARQLTQALRHSLHPDKGNTQFHFITKNLDQVYLVTMTQYYPEYTGNFFVEDKEIKNTLGEVIADHELRQLHIAETEKYAHVTKFFNGGKQIIFEGETDILVPSHKVTTYDLDPEMSAEEIYQQFVSYAPENDFVVINLANADMVGHTGNMPATIQAIEKLDKIVEKIIEFCEIHSYKLLITADHGNCEEMGTEEHPKTAHTTNKVPCWYIDGGEVKKIKQDGGLADVAPTILDLMGIKIPNEMTGKSLVTIPTK